LEGLEKVVNTMELTAECENAGMTKKHLDELVTSLQRKYKAKKCYEG